MFQCILTSLKESNTSGVKVIWVCISISILAHVVLALISPGILKIFNPDEELVVKKKKKREVVISILPKAPPKIAAEKLPPTPKKVDLPKPKPLEKKSEPKSTPKTDVAKAETVKPLPKRVDKKPEVVAKEKLAPRVVRTTEDQLSGVPTDTNLIGERNTIASSNAAVDPNAANRAAIKGEDSEFNETTNTRYQDGDLAHMNKGAPSTQEPPQPPTKTTESKPSEDSKKAEKPTEEVKSSVEESEKRGVAFEKKEKKETRDFSAEESEVKQYLETSNTSIELAKEATSQSNIKEKSNKSEDELKKEEEQNTIANKKVDPDGLKQKAVKEKQVQQKKTQPKKIAAFNAKAGFRSEAKATKFEGSISRRSKLGSSNVKGTPVGKYMAEVSKLVEREWQRRCSLKGDLIQPGRLRMSFLLNSRGKIDRISTISQSYGSEMNRSITFQAIHSAKIPVMPPKVRAIQNGDPIEFIYTFSF